MTAKKTHNFQCFTETDKPYGLTYGAWTVKWWQWALSLSADKPKDTPVGDLNGKHWRHKQPVSNVFFLAGNVAHIHEDYPHRSITMEYGRSILIPVLNCEANSLEYPKLKTHDAVIKYVEHDVSTVVKKEIFMNGTRLDSLRISSDPRIFKLKISERNAFGITKSGSTEAAADGYWVFLKPLPRGHYNISFEGSCEAGRLKAGASYALHID